jgi:CBS domain-containing membrane protein
LERQGVEKILHWLHGFLPAPIGVDHIERLRACCGALIGVLVTGLVTRLALGSSAGLPQLIAPMGASAVLLFALPASPMAQPWSIIGGNMISATIGVACAQWIGDPVAAAAVAITAAIAAMFALRCLHPPSGAIALTAVLGGPAIQAQGFAFVLHPVGINSLLLLVIAILFNNATRRRYPHPPQLDHHTIHHTADARPSDRLGFTPADLDDVLKHYNQVLDVSRDDLESLFLQAEMHAYRRRYGEITCADIMSRDMITVEFGTGLEEAWTLLRHHRIKALPVIDRARRVIGIVTLVDFMKHADLDLYDGFDAKLRRFIRRTFDTHSEKPEVVGQIMSAPVLTANQTAHIVELVPLLSDAGLHHIPIIDGERRLVGIVTQSDIVAALYRGRLADTSPVTAPAAAPVLAPVLQKYRN